ncbi:MAG: 23S rRNA (pseudouridine(1915)-N(3))-methyltransferase RlmH [Patescibacteria group bacterium]|nr:23S rRNA (pseudouridine(1915)-N(3))-methyltransferase RlmH [Patescibacteria group bacterium]
MKITLVTVGKAPQATIREIVADYAGRIGRYVNFDFIETTEEKLAAVLGKHDRVFLLDERGTECRSVEFADIIERQLNSGVKSVAFTIGGPFGFADDVRAVAQAKRGGSIALSKMTFPHDLVRVIFLEQLYRAFTIIRNEKYHHE